MGVPPLSQSVKEIVELPQTPCFEFMFLTNTSEHRNRIEYFISCIENRGTRQQLKHFLAETIEGHTYIVCHSKISKTFPPANLKLSDQGKNLFFLRSDLWVQP